jgi:hypothetical protein
LLLDVSIKTTPAPVAAHLKQYSASRIACDFSQIVVEGNFSVNGATNDKAATIGLLHARRLFFSSSYCTRPKVMCWDQRRQFVLFVIHLSTISTGSLAFTGLNHDRIQFSIGSTQWRRAKEWTHPPDHGRGAATSIGVSGTTPPASPASRRRSSYLLAADIPSPPPPSAGDLVGGDGDATQSLWVLATFSSFLMVVLAALIFQPPRDVELDPPVGSDPDAYRRAKSGTKILDPDRKWNDFYLNYNDDDLSGPFGMKKNAEIWNGRIAMVGVVRKKTTWE